MGRTSGRLEGPFTARAVIAFALDEEFANRVIATARDGTVITPPCARPTASRSPSHRNHDQEAIVDPRQRAQLGKAALDAGTSSRRRDDERTDAIEVVANVLHYLESLGEDDPAALLASAATHFFAEGDRAR
jgi:hypothetical protein